MAQQWTPFRDYKNYHHVLGAGFCFVHPGNGNIYGWACEQLAGKRQNLVIYRSVGGAAPVPIVTFEGAEDAESFIERGGCVIGHGGALWVATTLQPKGVVYDTQKRTGFEGVWCRIPNVDSPWSLSGLEQRMAALEQQLVSIETAIANTSPQGAIDALAGKVELLRLAVEGLGLGTEDREALDWVRELRALLRR